MIKNNGDSDSVLRLFKGDRVYMTVCLKPNETFSYTSDLADDFPILDLIDFQTDEEITMVGNSRHWNVTIPVDEDIVSGSWKKEGF